MEVKTTLGTIVIIGTTTFLMGCYYGYHRTKEKFFTEVAKVLADQNIKLDKENQELR